MPTPHLLRRLFGVLVAGLAVASIVTVPPAPAAADDASGITLVLTPSGEPLRDGEVLEVRAALDDPRATILSAGRVQVCRPGVAYDRDTYLPRGGHCPNTPFSTSGDLDSGETMFPFADRRSALGRLRIGVGTAEWTQRDTKHSLTCDQTLPCTLVVELRINPGDGSPVAYRYATQPLTFASSESVVAGCGDFPDAAPATAGADRVLDLWAEVTRSYCDSAGSLGVVTEAPRPGEGEALEAFGKGEVDLAYAAAGPSTPGFEIPEDRGYVAVPIAVNAAVVATIGGARIAGDPTWPEGLRRPYREVALTSAELATLLGEGPSFFAAARGDAVLRRNPELGAQPVQVAARSLSLAFESTPTWALTSRLDTMAPDAWRTFPGAGAEARGPVASFERSPLDFDSSLQRFSDLASLDKGVYQFAQPADVSGDGPLYVVADLATARRLDLSPVRLETAGGQFVGPTDEAVAAGLATLQPREDGTLGADPSSTRPDAYPLVMIEYAFAPTTALFDASACRPRTDAQQLLGTWLDFLVGPGQAHLPDGFLPLTPGLRDQAEAALAKVGSTVDPAAATSAPPGEDGSPTPGPGGGPGVGGPGLPPGYSETSYGASAQLDATRAAVAAVSVQAADPQAARAAADAGGIELPSPFGLGALSTAGPAAAVVGITALTSLSALGSAGRRPWGGAG